MRKVSVNVPHEADEDERDWAVVHGKMLADLSEAEWDELLTHNYIVFARYIFAVGSINIKS